ncbi:MAG: aldose 1-epimerase family protein, partial [Clostridia bacterium]|nr:aldose 1-epimerase family protein [Clostridia bacterium]
MSELITIKNEHLTATVSTLGAELQSLCDKDGKEYIWQGDPAVWSGRAPIL